MNKFTEQNDFPRSFEMNNNMHLTCYLLFPPGVNIAQKNVADLKLALPGASM